MPGNNAIEKEIEALGTSHPLKLLIRYAWPALIAMSLNALYAVVDRAFIGHGCGVDAIAGITMVFPVILVLNALGVFVGAGHGTVLSIKLGLDDRVSCEKLLGELIAFKLLLFIVISPLIYFNVDTVLGWCGANNVSPKAFAAAKEYLRLVIFSHLFSHLAYGLSAMQRAEGAATKSMFCIATGCLVNLILDPIFIFGFNLGIAGAAWATNIAMFCSCIVAFSYYLRGKTIVKLVFSRIGFYRDLALKSCAIGTAPFLQHIMGALVAVSMQLSFTYWITDTAKSTEQMASLGVYTATLLLVIMPIMGAQQGLQPIIGYNWGARNFRRVKQALYWGWAITTLLTVLAWVIQVIPPFPRLIAQCFISGNNPSLINLAAHDLALSNCMIWCISVNVVSTTYFQSIGKPKIAIFLSFFRQGLCMIPCIWLMPWLMDRKDFAIWLAVPISDVLCNALTIVPILFQLRFLTKVRSR